MSASKTKVNAEGKPQPIEWIAYLPKDKITNIIPFMRYSK